MVTAAWECAAATPDPELPMLTIEDLGILRSVDRAADGEITVTITPTYSGCPAMREISADVRSRLTRAGFVPVTVKTRLAPPWSTDWITEEGKRKLAAAGIAPPSPVGRSGHGRTGAGRTGAGRTGPVPLTLGQRPPSPACPRCGSPGTERTAQFSATACKSLHRCTTCGEPFEAVKPL